jgi:hypothetical protein
MLHIAVFSILLLLSLSYVQVYSSDLFINRAFNMRFNYKDLQVLHIDLRLVSFCFSIETRL